MSTEKDAAKSKALIGLTNVIFGIILAQAFQYFDGDLDYARTVLIASACLMLVLAWMYVRYNGLHDNKYSELVFFAELLILFVLSRLINAAHIFDPKAGVDIWFLLWFAILFTLFVIWGSIMLANAEAGSRNCLGLVINVLIMVLAWAAYLLCQSRALAYTANGYMAFLPLAFYLVAFLGWNALQIRAFVKAHCV